VGSWSEIERDAPEFAARVRRRFGMGVNKTIATLRHDGSPRISACEVEIDSGVVSFGTMGGAMKLLDLRRDPRIAIHSATIEQPSDVEDWPGDAKLAGRVIEVPPPADNEIEGAAFFTVDVSEVTLTYVGTPADHLVIESWHQGRGWSSRTRY
jgi:hypothetical protein